MNSNVKCDSASWPVGKLRFYVIPTVTQKQLFNVQTVTLKSKLFSYQPIENNQQ
jgi:hypothetical protein